jgi:hypothetical protein
LIEATTTSRADGQPQLQLGRNGLNSTQTVAVIWWLRYVELVSTNATVDVEIEVPADLARLHLPEGLDRRLQALLDQQEGGMPLSPDEQAEAEGLVDLADLLTLLRLRSSKICPAPG